MDLLEKQQHSSGTDTKYYIDCNSLDPASIEPIEIIKNTTISRRNPFDLTVLHAVAHSDLIRKKNRHIVVKISRTRSGDEYMAKIEFEIGKQLNGISGFIKFICLFTCNDDTSTHFVNTNEKTIPIPTSIPICSSTISGDRKFVLVMPYIREGSLLDYNWTHATIVLLKSLCIHVVFSLAEAFTKIGFIHGDLHWGNILFKRTTQSEIVYDINEKKTTLPTNGYKVVIMDFEKSKTKITDVRLLWRNIRKFIYSGCEISKRNGENMSWKCSKLIQQIDTCIENESSINSIYKIIHMIHESDFDIWA